MINMGELLKQIAEARDAAFREGIKANSIIINQNLVKYPGGYFSFGMGQVVSCLPPMICGLEVYGTKTELPEDYVFAVVEARQTEREKLIAETEKRTATMIFKTLANGVYSNELREVAEKFGVNLEDLQNADRA